MEELKKVSLKVDAPPQVDVQEKKSIFMDIGTIMNLMFPMLGMNLFLIYGMKSEQNQAGIYVYSGLFMAVMSAVCSILWLMISRKYEKREQQKKVNKERLAYRRYLNKKSEYIKVQYERVYKVLQSRYLRADTYLDSPLLDMYLWNRNLYHKDFLMYRIGIGDVEFPMKIEFPEEVFGDEENILWREAKKIKEHYEILHQIPVLLDMGRYSQIGIITKDTIAGMELVRSIILQIALCNCYTEVKIGCIYNKNKVIQSQQWDFCRWLPHIWDANRQKRFIAGNEVEARRLFYDLLQIFKEREEVSISGKAEKILPHYILFVAEEQFLEGEMFSKYILDRGREYGLTVVWLDSMRKKLPNTCKMVLEINGGFTGRYEIERHSQKKEKINFDYTEKNIAEKLIRSISGIKVMEIEEKAGIPEVVDFLGMYDVHTIEELHIKQRWEKNRIFESAKVLIGKKAGDEPFYLDIHERYHGPHGLLAGTTGSGKSEVLQTFILSMAVNFSPEAVCFLLIDYKGEGMSALFSELPHISGKISNLSDGQAYRAMVSIKSENKRRQRIFKECKVNNINDYTRLFNSGSVNEPIPHLLIIIDEFAELKKAEPEFMQELISVAQVGRSLGVHLLLATQKPGGVVDDKIWSNSRFRICLKVQEREDSMDMLHNMDACQITQTGRGYLQVGNNEVYELFQAGWSGALFQQEDTEVAACLVQTDAVILLDLINSVCEEGTVIEIFQKHNALGYAEFSYALGLGYFYDMGNITGKGASEKWFCEAIDTMTSQDENEAFGKQKRKRAGLYAKIANYYNTFLLNGTDQSGERGTGDFMDFYKTLHSLNQFEVTQKSTKSDLAAAYLISREITIEIMNYAEQFLKDSSINKKMLNKELEKIEERTKYFIKEKKQMEELYQFMNEAKQKIEIADSFKDKEDVRDAGGT